MVKYHIGKNGQPSVCHAERGRCPLGGMNAHFDTIQEAQDFADKINEKKSKVIYGTTKTKLIEKHPTVYGVIEAQDIEKRLRSVSTKIDELLNVIAYSKFQKLTKLQKKRGERKTKEEDFYKDFKENNHTYKELMAKKQKLMKDTIKLVEERFQADKFFNDRKHDMNDASFSNASSSAYFLMKESSLKETMKYLDDNGFEYQIRPDIEVALEDNYLVRFSDHTPGTYNYLEEARGKAVWEYTDASILVFYKDVEVPKANDKIVRQHLKELKNKKQSMKFS